MRTSLIAPLAAFLAPALLSIYFTFVTNDFNRGLVWDSAHYVLSSQLLLDWLSACLHQHYVSPATNNLGPSVMVDGPVLPALGATLIALGQLFHQSAEISILIGQSLLCGLNSLLLFTLAQRIVDRNVALAGALTLGLHPATIISASQFLTEQLTVTALLALTLAVSLALPRGRLRGQKTNSSLHYLFFGLSGALAALVLHLKTALFPTVAIILLLALASQRESACHKFAGRGKIVLAMAAGFFITIAPWLVFSKLASGRITLAPNRVPSINLAVGLDLESDAWGVAPPTQSVMPIIFDKPSAIGASLFLARPLGISSLLLRKIERLFVYSWNDFCWPFFGLNIYWQCLFQRLILAAAVLGFIYVIANEKLLNKDFNDLNNIQFVKIMILLMVAGHFIFVPFETQPRYGYSVLPFLICLGLIAAQKQLRQKKFPGTYASLSLLLILLAGSDINGPLFAVTGNIESTEVVRNMILATLAGICLVTGLTEALESLRFQYNRQLVITALGAVIAFCFLTARDYNFVPPEWSTSLPPGLRAEREIVIPADLARRWQTNFQNKDSWAAVLIDGDENLSDSQIAVNGLPLAGSVRPLIEFEQDYPFQSTIRELVKVAAKTRAQTPESLRQWRMIALPATALKLDGSANVLSVTPGAKTITLYGQYRGHGKGDEKLLIPSLYGFSALRLSILGDGRTIDRLKKRTAQSSCRFSAQYSADLSPDKSGEQSGDYRIYLIMAVPAPACDEGQNQATATTSAASQPTFKNHFWQIF